MSAAQLSEGRTAPNPWWVGIVAGMASYIDAAAIITAGIALVIYQQALGLTGNQVGLLSGGLTLGIAVGALFGGRLGDRFGRRRVFMITMAMIAIGAAVLVLSPSFVPLLLGILLVGLGTGADLPVSLTTISEVASDENRGKLLGFSQILWLVGIVVAAGLGVGLGSLGHLGGQLMFAHVGVVALLVLAARVTIPESSHWRAAQAERAAGVTTIRADRSRVSELLRSPYAASFVALIIFYSLINLAANTNGQYGTYLLVNVVGLPVALASLAPLVLVLVGIVPALWFMRVVDGPSRWTYFKIGAALSLLSPLVPAVLGLTVTTYVISGLLGVVGGAFAGEAIMKYWAQESFPTLLRATAQGTIIAVARFLAAGLATVTPLILTAGPRPLYIFLAAVSGGGLAAALLVFRRQDGHNEFDTETEQDPEVAVPTGDGVTGSTVSEPALG